jgi:hypothetical protein
MLAHLKNWYVFRIYQKASYKAYFAALIGIFILAISLDNLFKNYGLNFGQWLWTVGVAIEAIILLNVWLHRYLYNNIEIHEMAEDEEWERYFLGIDRDEGTPLFCRKGDFFLDPKADCELSCLAFPLVKDEEPRDLNGLIPKKIGNLETSFFCQEGSTKLDVIIYLKGHYDIHEVVNFVCQHYLEECRVYNGYEDFIMDMLEISTSKWVAEAQEAVRSKRKQEGSWKRNTGDVLFKDDDDEGCGDENCSVSEALSVYLELIRNNFKPPLLSNVDHIEVEISGSDDIIIGDNKPEKVEQPAGLKNKPN